MSEPLPGLELRRKVWRYEYGQLSGSLLWDVLDGESRWVGEAFEALGGGEGAVHRHAPALYGEFQASRVRADDALGTDRLRDALDEVLRGRELVERMRGLVDAHAVIEEATDVLEQLHAAVGVKRLRELPCLDAPACLLGLARERMREGRYVRAAYAARVCLRESAGLLPRDAPDTAREAGLRAALEDIRTLCEATRALLDDGTADLTGDGTLEAVAALVESGYVVLAERTVEELGARLAPRAHFLRELKEGGEDDAAPSMGELRERLAGTPADARWAAASAILRRARLDDHLGRMRAERQRLDDAARRGSFASPSPPEPSRPPWLRRG